MDAAFWLIDATVLLAMCGEDADLLGELCAVCANSLPEKLREVSDACHDGDAPRLRESAHKLRGFVSAFSAIAGDAAADLEELAAAGRIDEARLLADTFATTVDLLLAQVKSITLDSLKNHG
jgi:dihydrodipicolinate synthase/N-acetylneuraminate lyase